MSKLAVLADSTWVVEAWEDVPFVWKDIVCVSLGKPRIPENNNNSNNTSPHRP